MNLILALISSGALGFIAYQFLYTFGFLNLESNDSSKKMFISSISFIAILMSMFFMENIGVKDFNNVGSLLLMLSVSMIIMGIMILVYVKNIEKISQFIRNKNDAKDRPTPSNRDTLGTSIYVFYGREQSEVEPKPLFMAIYNSKKELVISGEVRSTPNPGERFLLPFDAHINKFNFTFDEALKKVDEDTYKNTVIYSPETKEYTFLFPSPAKQD